MSLNKKILELGFEEDSEEGLLYGYQDGNHEIVLLSQNQTNNFIISFVSVYGQMRLKNDLWFLLKDKYEFLINKLEKQLDICNQTDYDTRISATLYNEDGTDEMLSITLMIEGVFDLESIEKLLPSLKDNYKQYALEIDQRVDRILFGD